MITPEELKQGYKHTLRNAIHLIEEAEILTDHKHYSRAYVSYHFAIEEMGKCVILYRAILDHYMGTEITLDHLKDLGFSDHKTKMQHSIKSLLYPVILAKRSGLNMQPIIDGLIDDMGRIGEDFRIRNLGMYVDFDGHNFTFPRAQINKEMVDEIASKAELRLGALKPYLQPLETMEEVATGLSALLENPEEVQRINDELGI